MRRFKLLRSPAKSNSVVYWHPAIESIIGMVALVFDVTAEDIVSTRRGEAKLTLARQTAMYLTHTSLGLAQHKVGYWFGRDRTTVGHACQKVEDRRDDPATDRLLTSLETTIQFCRLCSVGNNPDV